MTAEIQSFHKTFRYDPDTGVLWWKPTEEYPHERVASSLVKNKYSTTFFGGYWYKTHQICFAMFHGYMAKEIDHENRIKSDNRILNLRDVTHRENILNSSRTSPIQSGIEGINCNKNKQTWYVFKRINGKQVYQGQHKDLEEAKKI